MSRLRPLRHFFGFLGISYIVASIVVGVVLAEVSLHLPKRRLDQASAFRAHIRNDFHADLQDVQITASDGAILKGWWIVPAIPNGDSVLILHGITDNREGAAGFADMFLTRGYSVLLPDSREHGESDGGVATYGILERDDVRRWVAWGRQRAPGCTYLLGESMGAAIGLEATAVTPQLCAVAVESPYSTFREIAYERLGRETKLGSFFWRTLGSPAIEFAILYSGMRYDVNLPRAEPLAAVETSSVPTLLIAGTADRNIPSHNAQELEQACPNHCSLWIVQGAGHGGAVAVAPAEFRERILGWFQSHKN